MNEVDMPPKIVSLIDLTIHPFGQERVIKFANAETIRTWLQDELTKWKVFHDSVSDYRSPFYHKVQEHRLLLTNAIGWASKISTTKEEDYEKSAKNLISCLRLLEQPPYLSSDNAGAQLIFDSSSSSVSTRVAVFALWIGEPLPNFLGKFVNDLDIFILLRASATWRMKDFGTSKEASKIGKKISGGLSKWEINFQNLSHHIELFTNNANKEASNSLISLHDIQQKLENFFNVKKDTFELLEVGKRNSLKKLEENYRSRFDDLFAEKSEALNNLFADRSEALNKLESTFREHLRLKAPAEYWTQKALRHRVNAKRWLVAVVGLSIFGIISFITGYSYLLAWLDSLKNQSIGTATIVLLALPGLLYASLVRITHRSYRDEIRQGDDAEQRSTLVQTYLALVHEETGNIQPSERLLALHALFRGSAQSDSPDDTPPINALEALLQGLKPKSGG